MPPLAFHLVPPLAFPLVFLVATFPARVASLAPSLVPLVPSLVSLVVVPQVAAGRQGISAHRCCAGHNAIQAMFCSEIS